MTRRDFLRGAAATSALLMSARLPRTLAAERRFAPVIVSRDRLIREVVGLRPYRSSGFVVDAERFGNKLLVHNYGHGGGGVTLSWGTASLAVDLARDFVTTNRRRRFAVLGCGVSGLSVARLLQRHFQNGPGTVTIYAKDLPPNTTSNVAGAWWSPTSVYESDQVDTTFNDQFRRACQISHRAFQLLVGPEYGVRWIDSFEFSRNEFTLNRELPGGDAFYPARQVHRDPERYFGFPFVRQYSTMLIEPSIYLSALLRDFYIAGGRLVVKEFRNRREILRLPESVVFNCTGLGARDLFDDPELTPVRGQIEVLLPQPEIDYCYLSSGYMFPRRDGIVLGGTWDYSDWSLLPNTEQANQILETHASIMKSLRSAD